METHIMASKLIWLALAALALAACSEIAEHGGLQGMTALEPAKIVLI
ncbi:MAG: hypothetical protein AAF576_07000 [Pseudomonadota bacterium]